MHRKLRRTAAIAATVTALVGGGALTASAVINNTPQTAANGNAGYDAVTADPAGFNQIQTVAAPNQYGTTIKTGAQGVQLCSSATNRALQLGLTSNNMSPNYTVAFASGTLPAPGCPTAGVLPNPRTISPSLSVVPAGHHVWVSITVSPVTRTHRVLICVRHNGVFICHKATITVQRNQALFEAQDLDANTNSPVTDAPGVVTRTVNVRGTQIFNHADAGVNEDQTTLTACSSTTPVFPRMLGGPAVYTTAACQPVGAFDYTQAQIGTMHMPLSALPTTEGISPNATGALVAPNNTIRASVTADGPHGTATNAVTTGDHFEMFTGNVTLGTTTTGPAPAPAGT